MGRSFLATGLGGGSDGRWGEDAGGPGGWQWPRLAGPCFEDRPRLAEPAQHLRSLRPGIPRRGGPRRRLEPPDPTREELRIRRGSHQLVPDLHVDRAGGSERIAVEDRQLRTIAVSPEQVPAAVRHGRSPPSLVISRN